LSNQVSEVEQEIMMMNLRLQDFMKQTNVVIKMLMDENKKLKEAKKEKQD